MRILIAAALSLLASKALAQPATPPPSEEGLVFTKPAGFVGFNAAGNDTFYTAEFVPEAERSGTWTTKVALVAMRETPTRAALEFNAEQAARIAESCPQAVSELLDSGTENGFRYAVTRTDCRAETNGRKPAYYLRKSIGGKTVFLSVVYTYRSEPDATVTADALAYLKTVTLCAKTDGVC